MTEEQQIEYQQLREQVYNLKLGEGCYVAYVELIRVPGGWVATTHAGITFVPLHHEFQ